MATARVQLERKTSVREAQASQAFPSNRSFAWERQDGESIQAFSRFLAYRDMEPSERSQRKVADVCGISNQLVARWGKRWQWLKRALAYDMWLLELSDQLGKRAVLSHRGHVVRFGSLSLAKASATVAKLDEAKLSADEAIALAVSGVKLSRQALGLADAQAGETRADRAPVAQVAVSFGSAPPWLARPVEQNEAKLIEAKQNEVLVSVAEQVLAETAPVLRRARLAERKVNCPKGKV